MKKIVMAAIVVAALVLAASAPTLAARGIEWFTGDIGMSSIGYDQDANVSGSVAGGQVSSPVANGHHTATVATAAAPSTPRPAVVAAPRSLPATSTR